MDRTAVLAKTAKGAEELKSRAEALSGKTRAQAFGARAAALADQHFGRR